MHICSNHYVKMRCKSVKYYYFYYYHYYYYYYLCNVISDCSLKYVLYMGVCHCFLCEVTIHHSTSLMLSSSSSSVLPQSFDKDHGNTKVMSQNVRF